jgi:hypothetical protein
MKQKIAYLFFSLVLLLSFSCKKTEVPPEEIKLQLVSVSVGASKLNLDGPNAGMETGVPLVVRFSQALDRESVPGNVQLLDQADVPVAMQFSFLDEDRTFSALPDEALEKNSSYTLRLGDRLIGSKGEIFPGLEVDFQTLNTPLTILEVKLDGAVIDPESRVQDVSFTPAFELSFSEKLSVEELSSHSSVLRGSLSYPLLIESVNDSVFRFTVSETLPDLHRYSFNISSSLSDAVDKEFGGLKLYFYTRVDSVYKFPELSEEELLTLVQQQTFKYFWDYGHPVSGLARERNHGDDRVTSGGSGFGLMALLVGMERGFITRSEGLARIEKIVNFLATADRFHGAWSHWLNGSTGAALPFSTYDNGGDLVETSYMAMGLLTVRQYLDEADAGEGLLIEKINALWEGIEWDWYTRGEDALYWHWSPDYEWQMNMQIRGYNEALITYVLAASSPGHGIDAVAYHTTWARNGDIVHNQSYYGINLPVSNQAYGGPLFFAHYSFLGINPRGLSDSYANYEEQTVNHSLINQAYCADNPANYVGYSEDCWGLTASDGFSGYSAHSPTNDRGVLTPTAALSSFPYTPEQSMQALEHFYYLLGDRLWGEYGFRDAFSPTDDWIADSYLAIDQGPIIVMIENHRTGLLWELFMSAPEIRTGLSSLGFTFPAL